MEDLQKEVKGDLISRAHIANAMMAKGFVYSKAEAFKIYLRTGGLASEPKKELNALEAVSFIKSIGGLASLAHPKLTGLSGVFILGFVNNYNSYNNNNRYNSPTHKFSFVHN